MTGPDVEHVPGRDLLGTTRPVDDLDLRRRFFSRPDPEVAWCRANADLAGLDGG